MEDNAQNQQQTTLTMNAPDENVLAIAMKYYNQYVRPYILLYPIALVTALIAGLIYSLTVTKQFRATCRLQISNQEMRPLDVRNVMEQSGGGGAFLQTQMTILHESFILREAMNRLGTAGENAAAFRGPKVSQVNGTNLVDISFESSSKDLAPALANALADAYISFIKERKGDISSSGEGLLRDQLKDAERNREHAMADLLKFKEEHGIYDFDQLRGAYTAQLDTLTSKIAEQEIQIGEITRSLDDISRNRREAAILLPFLLPSDGSDSASSVNSIKMMIMTHDMALPKLMADYGERHTAVTSHHQVRKMLVEAQEEAVNISIRGLKMRLERIRTSMAQQKARMKEVEKKLNDLDHLGGAYKQKEAAYASFSNTCTMLINRINEIRIAAASTKVDNFSIAVIDRARTPVAPFYPITKNILLRAVIAGLAIAFAISFILVTLDVNVADLDTARQAIGMQLPSFGTIPHFDKEESELIEPKNESEVDLTFQNVRTSLNLSMQTRGTRFLAVSSSIPGEGKTFISYNLARSFAKDGRKTLLLELDMRLPRIAKLLKDYLPENATKRGLSNVVVGDCKLEDVIIPIPKLGIDVALTGPIPPNPNELIGSNGLKKLLDEASRLYDLTIIDTPPIIPVTDTLLLTAMNIPLLLVVRFNYITRTDLHMLNERMTQVNLKPVGLITNCEEAHTKEYRYKKYGKYGKYGRYGRYGGYGRYGYGYKYGYGYGYGHAHDNADKDGQRNTDSDKKQETPKK